MMKLVENVKAGICSPRNLVTAETTRRCFSLELSKFKDISNVFMSGINSLDIDSTEARYLLSGTADGGVYIHDIQNFSGSPQSTAQVIYQTERGQRCGHKYSVECVQWYPLDNGLFITSGMDKTLRIWDSNLMKPIETVRFEGRIFQHHLSTSAHQHRLVAVATSVSEAHLVDISSGACVQELRGHLKSVPCCQWSPRDEFLLATGSCDNRVLLWDVRSSKTCLMCLDQYNKQGPSRKNIIGTAHEGYVNSLHFTEDGFYLLSLGTDNHLRLWNMFTGQNEVVNYGKVPNDTKKCVKISVTVGSNPPLVYIPSEGNILAFDIHVGTKVNIMLGHYNTVNCCTFNAVTQELYSGGNDRNVLVWSSAHGQKEAYDDHLRNSQEPTDLSHSVTPLRRPIVDSWSSDEEM